MHTIDEQYDQRVIVKVGNIEIDIRYDQEGVTIDLNHKEETVRTISQEF